MSSRRWNTGGLILILIGVFFLLMNFHIIPWDLKRLWPVLLIVLGLAEIYDRW